MSVSQTPNQMQKLDAERVKQSSVVEHVIAPALKGKTDDPDPRRCREIAHHQLRLLTPNSASTNRLSRSEPDTSDPFRWDSWPGTLLRREINIQADTQIIGPITA